MAAVAASPALERFRQPAPFRIIRNFLGDALADGLLAYALDHEDAFTESKVWVSGQGRIEPEIRISRTLNTLGPWRDTLEGRFLAVQDWAAENLQMAPFTVGGLELELAAHNDGDFYGRHIDTHLDADKDPSVPAKRADRVLTGVYYFHARPKGYGGGDLRMQSILPAEQGGRFIDITPEHDMLLLFPSWAYHEVRPVTCATKAFGDSRFAINGWFRRRPPEG